MGYSQVDVMPVDSHKKAFITHKGLFVYNVILFILCNAFATFQRLMKRIVGLLIGNCVLVYLDDVLIFATTIKSY